MKNGLISIALASAVISGALLALVYGVGAKGPEPAWVAWLPFVNATFNTLSAVAIVAGVVAIKGGREQTHRRWMFAALASSGVFLVSYVTYHALHGDSRFLGQGIVRPIYFVILISHILLSIVALPLVLSTFYLSLSGRFDIHRRVAKWTFPIWLYVSVTGVVVFLMLQIFGAAPPA
jgi:putative membrane protein